MIQKILVGQEKLIPEYQTKWLNIGTSSLENCNIQHTIDTIYTLLGLETPNSVNKIVSFGATG